MLPQVAAVPAFALPVLDCGPLTPVCDSVSSVPGGVVDAALGGLGQGFVTAASAVSSSTLDAMDATTGVDLGASWFRSNLAVIAVVTLPIVVALFALQVIASVLRREPGGLLRALTGVGKATVGAAVAVVVTQAALTATDGVCEAIAAASGTTVSAAAERAVSLTYLSGPQAAPMLQIVLGLVVLVGCLLLWAVLLFRKAAVLLVVVFAPVAFAGSVFDHTRVWTRRWIEAVVALVACKIVIVVVFVLGAAAFGSTPGAEPDGSASSMASGLSDVLVGCLLLSIAICAPWVTWRLVHWSGVEAGTVLHSTLAASPVPAAARRSGAMATRLGLQAAGTAVAGPGGAAVGSAATAGAGGAGSRSATAPVSAPVVGTGAAPPAARSARPPSPRGPAATTVLDRPNAALGSDSARRSGGAGSAR